MRVRTVLAATAAMVAIATPAEAAAPADKPAVMSRWTQPTATAYAAWDDARNHRSAWSAYGFDWSTDYCTTSPDQPLGFDFRNPCAHHDWGYRNYKAIDQFDGNKPRLDDTFYFDLKTVCGQVPSWQEATCDGLAWTYYQAVKNLGGLGAVSDTDLDQAARQLASAEERHRAALAH